MALTLIAILLALAAAQALPDLVRLRDFSAVRGWVARWNHFAGESAHGAGVLIAPLLVFALTALVAWLLDGHGLGLPGFAFAVVVLFLSFGPRELESDIDAVLAPPDDERREAAAQALADDGRRIAFDAPSLVEASFAASLSRRFGVIFWFVLLGPAGALGYRVVQLMAHAPGLRGEFAVDQQALLARAARALDWAPAHLIALTLALVADFDAVLRTWRDYHAAHGRGYFTLDLGFLPALARAGIDADVIAGDGYAADVSDPLVELADARAVLRRVLVAWLVVIAIVVIGGWAGH